MFMTVDETNSLIHADKLLHISGSESLLRQLDRGKWIGGTTEYFVSESGGVESDQVLDVDELDYDVYKLAVYNDANLPRITADAYENGFTVLIIPFESAVHKIYAQHVTEYEDLFTKCILGWISGMNLGKTDAKAYTVNGYTGEFYQDKAVAAHIKLDESLTPNLNIINIFSPNADSPVLTVDSDNAGFVIRTCKIDGRDANLADYISEHDVDIRLPLIGDYSGAGINVSIKEIKDGEVFLYAPVFEGIEYRFAENIPDYEYGFNQEMRSISDKNSVFACNCILNYLYGELEGKKLDGLFGPVTFGEIAWQLLNQTLVYLQISGGVEKNAPEYEYAGVVG